MDGWVWWRANRLEYWQNKNTINREIIYEVGDAGTLSIFFNTTYNGKEYRAGMFDGAGARFIAD